MSQQRLVGIRLMIWRALNPGGVAWCRPGALWMLDFAPFFVIAPMDKMGFCRDNTFSRFICSKGMHLEDFEKTLRTNLTGAFMIARQIDRDIVGKYPATLINVASMYALNGAHHRIYDGMPFKNFSAYGVTKARIHGLTVWLAGYSVGRQATVNTIAPGAVFNGHSEEFQRRVSDLIMADRIGQPDEIANVMLFLASEGAGYMTGQLVNVDGGFSAW